MRNENFLTQAAEERRMKFEAKQKIFFEEKANKAAEVRARKAAVGNLTEEQIE